MITRRGIVAMAFVLPSVNVFGATARLSVLRQRRDRIDVLLDRFASGHPISSALRGRLAHLNAEIARLV